MKIIVTSSLGNISKPLTKELVSKGHKVTVISSKPEKKKAIEALGATVAIGIIEDVQFLTESFTGADAVYCMLPPFNYFDPNLDVMAATRRQIGNYCKVILNSGVKKVVHLSSIGAHTDKGNGVLAFHHLAESLFKELPADVIIKHMRPAGFYTNLYDFKTMIKGEGFGGFYLTLRYAGLWNVLTGKRGVIAANYGTDDFNPWVSPEDIAAAIAEELTAPFTERMYRYVASEELTCNAIAAIIGQAIGKPYLKWAIMSNQDMLNGLKMFKMPESSAQCIVEMNAGIHNGLINDHYNKHRPKVFGKVKMTDFAKEFASVYPNNHLPCCMNSMPPYQIKSITMYHHLLGLPKPEHPLISVIDMESFKPVPVSKMLASLMFDFYCISLKKNVSAKMKYGQQTCDFDEGVLFCMAPGQVWGLEFNQEAIGTAPTLSGWMMLIHPDFLWNTPLAVAIKQYQYFNYAVHEALYVSEKEEALMNGIADHIKQEYRNNLDKFSEPVIIAQLELMLTYADRFYQRQFITRKVSSHQLVAQVDELLTAYFDSDDLTEKGLPMVSDIAGQLHVSPGYLSELLKTLTGQSTQQHIHNKLIERAKELLSTTGMSVSEVAYAVGFEHLPSFSKLFKAKTSLSPAAFRASFN